MILSALLTVISLLAVSAHAIAPPYYNVIVARVIANLETRSINNDENVLNIRSLNDNEPLFDIRSLDDKTLVNDLLYVRALLDGDASSDLLHPRSPLPRGGGGGGKASPKPKPKDPKKPGGGDGQCATKTPLSPDMKGKVDHCSRVKNSFGDASAMGSVGPCGGLCAGITGAIQGSMIDKVCTKEVKAAMASQAC